MGAGVARELPSGASFGSGRHGRASVAILAVACLFTALAGLSLWSWRSFANSQGFADVATDMLKEPAVREAVADQILNALEEQAAASPVVLAARPLLEQVVSEVVATDAFQGIFHAGVRELHSAVFQGHRAGMNVRVDDAAQLVKNTIRLINPGLAEAIPDEALEVPVGVLQNMPADRLMTTAEFAGWLVIPFAAAAIVCFVLAVSRSRNPRRTMEAVGLCLVGLGVAFFVVLAIGVNVFAGFGEGPRERTALRAVFWSMTHLLNLEAKTAIIAGAAIAVAAAYSGTGRIRQRVDEIVHRSRVRLKQPSWRAGACVALDRCRRLRKRVADRHRGDTDQAARVRGVRRWRRRSPGSARLLQVGDHRQSPVPGYGTPTRRWVRGRDRLHQCDVALRWSGVHACAPRTDTGTAGDGRHGVQRAHASFAIAGSTTPCSSGPTTRWQGAPKRDGSSVTSGADCRRSWDLACARFCSICTTAPRSTTLCAPASRAKPRSRCYEAELSPEQRVFVDRFLATLGPPPSVDSREVYLCHVYCELGATRAVDAFRTVDDFLRENPNEVLILILEDHVEPEDAIDVLERAGLADRAYTWEPGTKLPTLREMIESGDNVLVLVENEGGSRDWYMPAYGAILQDTPYKFETTAAFSCRHARGPANAPLLLANHWLTTDPPSPVIATTVNATEELMRRVEDCETRRSDPPNILAVDFYNRGDVFDVVDQLNGVAATTG